eukprot:scaffold8120_cov239-Pinguiococcus_pyrenoidosus.AAC.3
MALCMREPVVSGAFEVRLLSQPQSGRKSRCTRLAVPEFFVSLPRVAVIHVLLVSGRKASPE